jgi:hypothetical protein
VLSAEIVIGSPKTHEDDIVVEGWEIIQNYIYCIKVCLSYLTELGGVHGHLPALCKAY